VNVEEVTRLEIIDHTPCDTCKGKRFVIVEGEKGLTICPFCNGNGFPGRAVIFRDDTKSIILSLQDDGRTLKIFINERGQDVN
jgi:hypothetical protein